MARAARGQFARNTGRCYNDARNEWSWWLRLVPLQEGTEEKHRVAEAVVLMCTTHPES